MASVQDSVDPSVLYELKQQAIEYYAQNGVPQKMEEILNSMFYDKPNDVFGHMVSLFLLRERSPGSIYYLWLEGLTRMASQNQNQVPPRRLDFSIRPLKSQTEIKYPPSPPNNIDITLQNGNSLSMGAT